MALLKAVTTTLRIDKVAKEKSRYEKLVTKIEFRERSYKSLFDVCRKCGYGNAIAGMWE